DVAGVVEHAAEVAAEVADVAADAIRALDRQVEGGMRPALAAVVVRRVAVDEAVGDPEVHRLRRERLVGSAQLRPGQLQRGFGARERSGGRVPRPTAGHRQQQRQRECRPPHAGCPWPSATGTGTRSTHSPAITRLTAPTTIAITGWLPRKALSTKPRMLAATSCGRTMKKLKMPM